MAAKNILLPVTEFGDGVVFSPARSQRLNLDLIKLVLLDKLGDNWIDYYEPSKQKNINIKTDRTLAQIQDLADATLYDHGLVFVLVTKFDGITLNYPKYGLLNEKAVVHRVELPEAFVSLNTVDFGDSDHADQKEIEVIYLDEGYAGYYGYDTGEGASADVTAALTVGPCWAASVAKNYTVLVDRGGFTGVLYIEIHGNTNWVATSATLANPLVSAVIAITSTAGPFSSNVSDQLQVIIRDTNAAGAILYSFRTAIAECVV